MATPNPMKNLEAMNISMLIPIDWRTTPPIMIIQPVMTPILRPKISAIYGVIGRATIDPTDIMALRRPRVAAFGLSKAAVVSEIQTNPKRL
jgi:hypothetical protein